MKTSALSLRGRFHKIADSVSDVGGLAEDLSEYAMGGVISGIAGNNCPLFLNLVGVKKGNRKDMQRELDVCDLQKVHTYTRRAGGFGSCRLAASGRLAVGAESADEAATSASNARVCSTKACVDSFRYSA